MVGARFRDKGVVVTGAAGAIGYSIALAFAGEGARLTLIDLHALSTGQRDALLAAGATAVETHACDITDDAALVAIVEGIDGLDVIVNVAGMMIYKPLAELTGVDWRRLLDVNLVGAALLTGAALRVMRDGGAIVNIASIHAQQTSALVAPYAAAKAALVSLTRSAAIEGRARGIRANAILPGAIDTPMLWASPNIAAGIEVIAPADVGTPQDIAAAALFLASPEARFITGAALLVDGGRLAQL